MDILNPSRNGDLWGDLWLLMFFFFFSGDSWGFTQHIWGYRSGNVVFAKNMWDLTNKYGNIMRI